VKLKAIKWLVLSGRDSHTRLCLSVLYINEKSGTNYDTPWMYCTNIAGTLRTMRIPVLKSHKLSRRKVQKDIEFSRLDLDWEIQRSRYKNMGNNSLHQTKPLHLKSWELQDLGVKDLSHWIVQAVTELDRPEFGALNWERLAKSSRQDQMYQTSLAHLEQWEVEFWSWVTCQTGIDFMNCNELGKLVQ